MGDGQEAAKAEKGADGPGTVDRWQMVPEYGICKKGEPVSYTHLDVYKRQVPLRTGERSPGEAPEARQSSRAYGPALHGHGRPQSDQIRCPCNIW